MERFGRNLQNKWSPFEKQLISNIQRHSILYAGDDKLSEESLVSKVKETWEVIGRETNSGDLSCQLYFDEIQKCYLKAKQSKSNRINLTSKYLDGSLDFLEPYINNFKTKQLLFVSNKNTYTNRDGSNFNEDNSAFKLKTVTQQELQLLIRNKKDRCKTSALYMDDFMRLIRESVNESLLRHPKQSFRQMNRRTHKLSPEHINTISNDVDVEECLLKIEIRKNAEPLASDDDSIPVNDAQVLKDSKDFVDSSDVDNSEQQSMTKFFSDLAVYVNENFSTDKQKELRLRIGSLISEIGRK